MQNVHLVIGNESCDLDSMVSSLLFAFFLHKHRVPLISAGTMVISVMNVSMEHFSLRTENCYVLKELGIDVESLIFWDEIDWNKISSLTTTLVDHHILSGKQSFLEESVIQIIDHRPMDPSSPWKSCKVAMNIKEVSSCTTLVADEILMVSEDILSQETAWLIYGVIIYDSIALSPENGRVKDLDIEVAEKLETRYGFEKGKRRQLFDRLWIAHNDVSHLSSKQLLLKDLKTVECIFVPGLPMLVEGFLKLEHAYEDITSFANDNQTSLVVLIGLEAINGVRRDAALFWTDPKGETLKDLLLEKFKCSKTSKGYDFLFECVESNYDNLILLHQGNIKLSRKQIIPLIKEVVLEFPSCRI